MGSLAIAPGAFDQGLKIMRTQALPSLRLMEGFKGAVILGDRETGKALYVTFWETEEALRKSEEGAAELRDESAEALELTDVPVERYEVFLLETVGEEPT
jgi:heme-degrading monooxygenase HmoA